MKVTLTASTGAKILVWREDDDLFSARRVDRAEPAQTCLGVDLFEVLAELAGLDLDTAEGSAEAMDLATQARESTAPSECGRHPSAGNEPEAGSGSP